MEFPVEIICSNAQTCSASALRGRTATYAANNIANSIQNITRVLFRFIFLRINETGDELGDTDPQRICVNSLLKQILVDLPEVVHREGAREAAQDLRNIRAAGLFGGASGWGDGRRAATRVGGSSRGQPVRCLIPTHIGISAAYVTAAGGRFGGGFRRSSRGGGSRNTAEGILLYTGFRANRGHIVILFLFRAAEKGGGKRHGEEQGDNLPSVLFHQNDLPFFSHRNIRLGGSMEQNAEKSPIFCLRLHPDLHIFESSILPLYKYPRSQA